MILEKEKSILVHWYYTVSEWEEFALQGKRKPMILLIAEALSVGTLIFMFVYFSWNLGLIRSMAIGANIAAIYAFTKYYISIRRLKWRSAKMPEICIADSTVTINGISTIFQGNGIWLRKADIREVANINVLEINFEWQAGLDICSDEIKIPVPKGRLREAVALLDCLNLRRDLLTMFSGEAV